MIERGKAFADAGASGFFVPRLSDPKQIERVVREVPLPLNVIAFPGAPDKTTDARLYPFLSRAYDSSPGQADEVIKRFRRFAELQPRNGRAQYYYAMSLWKGKRAQDPSVDLHEVEALLKKSIALDPSLAEAQLQLGNLYSDQTHYAEAIPYYKRAIALNSDLPTRTIASAKPTFAPVKKISRSPSLRSISNSARNISPISTSNAPKSASSSCPRKNPPRLRNAPANPLTQLSSRARLA